MSAPLDAEPHEDHDDEPREEDATVLSQTGVLRSPMRRRNLKNSMRRRNLSSI